MKKALKRITALALAAVTAGALGLSAAADEIRQWSVADVKTPGAPSISNWTTVYMMATKDPYYAMAETMTDLVSREVTITCDNYTMSRTIRFNAAGTEQSWRLTDESFSKDACYKVTANTTLSGVILNSTGYIKRVAV